LAECGAGLAGKADHLARYKRDVACRIHARNPAHLYDGAPPPVLRSVVVLSVRVDARGRPSRIRVIRSNGIRVLERRAIQSVRAAAPLPIPAAALLRRGATDITETWLFRDDGRFQVRTLAQVQAPSGY
jgi:protein TonB